MESTATLRMAHISPRKVKLVADLVRGRDVDQALEMLTFTRKKSAPMIKKLVESAVANAEQAAEQSEEAFDVDTLYVKSIQVGRGPYMRRYRPRAMGRATPVRKPTSNITVVLGTLEQ